MPDAAAAERRMPAGAVAPTNRPSGKPASLATREIVEGDLTAIAALLSEGFPGKSLAWFETALARVAQLPDVPGLPRFGYVLVAKSQPVGAVLIFGTQQDGDGRCDRRLNVACWYVRPRYRAYGTVLYQRLLAIGDATFLNVTPADHTWPILEAQGFGRFTDGTVIGLPWLRRSATGIGILPAGAALDGVLPVHERKLLQFHAAAGCVVFACVTPAGILPFVFRRRLLRRFLPAAQLIYCRDVADFGHCAGAVGRHLARHGLVAMMVGANGSLPGIPGRYLHGKYPMYYKGASKPRVGDLAYTELALLSP